MRAAHAALAPALLTVALLGAGCGGGDKGDENAFTPTPVATGPTTTPDPGSSQSGASGSGSSGDDSSSSSSGLSAKDSLSTQIAKNPDLRTFSTALAAAGLTPILDRGTYTVFAPNNDAFTKLGTQLDTLLQPAGKLQLQNILRFHIVKGKVKTKKLKDGKLLTTLQGDRVRVTERGGELLIGNSLGKATIIVPDAKASNGVIQTVDSVLRPKTGVQ